MRFLFFFIIGINLAFGQNESIKIDISNSIPNPQQYVVHKTQNTINIDGKADEEDWRDALFTASFIDIEGVKTPKFNTQVKMLWDEEYLYIYAKLDEPHIWGDITQHDAVIFHNNDFEVFIDPTDDTYDYTEIEVNALNTTWDLKLNKPYRMGGRANNYYEITGLKTAVYLDGTLNDPSDEDNYWSVEMAIPMEVVMRAKRGHRKFPRVRDYWRINFSRVQWEHELIDNRYQRKKIDGKLLPEYNWVWSNQKAINMHIPEHWGYIEFSNHPPSKPKSFTSINNQTNQQVAYALMRLIKWGKHKALLKSPAGAQKNIEPFEFDKQTFECTFMKTYMGFEIYGNNISRGSAFAIDHMGDFRFYDSK